jgi:hypothetical protein
VRCTSTTDADGLLGEPPAELGAVLDLTHALGKYLPHTPGSIKTEHEPDIYDLRIEHVIYLQYRGCAHRIEEAMPAINTSHE